MEPDAALLSLVRLTGLWLGRVRVPLGGRAVVSAGER